MGSTVKVIPFFPCCYVRETDEDAFCDFVKKTVQTFWTFGTIMSTSLVRCLNTDDLHRMMERDGVKIHNPEGLSKLWTEHILQKHYPGLQMMRPSIVEYIGTRALNKIPKSVVDFQEIQKLDVFPDAKGVSLENPDDFWKKLIHPVKNNMSAIDRFVKTELAEDLDPQSAIDIAQAMNKTAQIAAYAAVLGIEHSIDNFATEALFMDKLPKDVNVNALIKQHTSKESEDGLVRQLDRWKKWLKVPTSFPNKKTKRRVLAIVQKMFSPEIQNILSIEPPQDRPATVDERAQFALAMMNTSPSSHSKKDASMIFASRFNESMEFKLDTGKRIGPFAVTNDVYDFLIAREVPPEFLTKQTLGLTEIIQAPWSSLETNAKNGIIVREFADNLESLTTYFADNGNVSEALLKLKALPDERVVNKYVKALASYVRTKDSPGFCFVQRLFSDTLTDADAVIGARRTLARENVVRLDNLVNNKLTGNVPAEWARAMYVMRDASKAIRSLPSGTCDAVLADAMIQFAEALRADCDPMPGVAQLAASPRFVKSSVKFADPDVTQAQKNALSNQESKITLYFWATGTGKTTAMWAEVFGALQKGVSCAFVVLQKWDLLSQFLSDAINSETGIAPRLAKNVKVNKIHRKSGAPAIEVKETERNLKGGKTIARRLVNDRIVRVSISQVVDNVESEIEVVVSTYDTLAIFGRHEMGITSEIRRGAKKDTFSELLDPFFDCSDPYVIFDEAHLLRNQMAFECLKGGGMKQNTVINTPWPTEFKKKKGRLVPALDEVGAEEEEEEARVTDDANIEDQAAGEEPEVSQLADIDIAPEDLAEATESDQTDAAAYDRAEVRPSPVDAPAAASETSKTLPYGAFEATLWFLRFGWNGNNRPASRVSLLTATPVGQRPDQFFRMLEAAVFLTSQELNVEENGERMSRAIRSVKSYSDKLVKKVDGGARKEDPVNMYLMIAFTAKHLKEIEADVSVDFINDETMPRRNYAQSAVAVVNGGLALREGDPIRVPLGIHGARLQNRVSNRLICRQLCNGYFSADDEYMAFTHQRYKVLFKWLHKCRMRACFVGKSVPRVVAFKQALQGFGERGTTANGTAAKPDELELMIGKGNTVKQGFNDIDYVADYLCSRLTLHSEKLDLIADAVTQHKGSPSVVFCDYQSIGGADHLELLLRDRGWKERSDGIQGDKCRRYVIISKNVSMKDRQKWAFNEDSEFNSHENACGDKIACLIVLPAGHVSITLRNVHVAHFVNMPLDIGRSVQMLGRIARRSKPEPGSGGGIPVGYFAGFSISEHRLTEPCNVKDTTQARKKPSKQLESSLNNITRKIMKQAEEQADDANSDHGRDDVDEERESKRARVGATFGGGKSSDGFTFEKMPVVTYAHYIAGGAVTERYQTAEERLAYSGATGAWGIVEKTRYICIQQAAITAAARNLNRDEIHRATGWLSSDLLTFIASSDHGSKA